MRWCRLTCEGICAPAANVRKSALPSFASRNAARCTNGRSGEAAPQRLTLSPKSGEGRPRPHPRPAVSPSATFMRLAATWRKLHAQRRVELLCLPQRFRSGDIGRRAVPPTAQPLSAAFQATQNDEVKRRQRTDGACFHSIERAAADLARGLRSISFPCAPFPCLLAGFASVE